MVDWFVDTLKNIDISTSENKSVALAFATIGAIYFSKFAFWSLKGLFKYILLPRRNLYHRYGGGYALVTGASDGMGKEYARSLA